VKKRQHAENERLNWMLQFFANVRFSQSRSDLVKLHAHMGVFRGGRGPPIEIFFAPFKWGL